MVISCSTGQKDMKRTQRHTQLKIYNIATARLDTAIKGQKLKAFRYWYKLIVGQMDTPTNRFTTLRLKRSNLQPLVDCLLGPQKLFLPFLEKEKEEKEEESKYMKN